MSESGCQSAVGVWEVEPCGLETVPGTKYCLEHGTVPTAKEACDE